MVIEADLNGHADQGKRGDEKLVGRYGVEQNEEGHMVVEFAERMEMFLMSTKFMKR